MSVQQVLVDANNRLMLRRWVAMCAGASMLIGFLALLGWALSVSWLKGIDAQWVSMRVNTAAGIVVAGIGLLAQVERGPGWQLTGRLAGLLVLALGLLTLAEYAFGWDAGIDHLFHAEPASDFGVSAPGRMAPLTAGGFALYGLGLLSAKTSLLRQLAAILVGLSALRVMLGYIYGIQVFYELQVNVDVAANTAVAFSILAAGLQCTIAESSIMHVLTGHRAGSILARRLLPAVIFLPIIFEWLRLYGEKSGWFNAGFGTAMTVLASISLLLLISFRALAMLNTREAAISEQTRLLELVLDSMSDGVVIADKEGRLTRFNRAAENLLGFGPNNGVAETWAAQYGVHHPETLELYQPHESPMARALKGQQVDGEEQYIINSQRPEGLYISSTSRAIRDDRQVIIGAVAVLREITEQRQSRKLLAQASLYEQSRGAVLTLFNQGLDRQPLLQGLLKLLAGHRAFMTAAFYGYDSWRDSFLLEAAYAAPPELAQSFRAGEGLLGQAVADNEPLLMDVTLSGLTLDIGFARLSPEAVLGIPVNHQDSRQGFLLVACTRMPTDTDKEFLRHLCYQLGIALHNQRQYENLRFLAEQLRLRSEEIAEKNRELEAASQMKSEFLANMSHELRTPLNAIIGFSEVLMDGLLGELDERQKHSVKDIYESGNHLLELINDILDLSKVEAGHMDLQLQPVELTALLQNSLTIVREKAMALHLSLKLQIPSAPVQISADARRLKQIVYNLLSNAVKFTGEGGTVQLWLQEIDGNDIAAIPADYRSGLAMSDGRYIGISVKDTGIGICEADLQRLFQPFVQLDSSLSRQYNGTGLGLVMVKYLTELHGGLVTVSSRQNQGSTFCVWLPLNPVPLSLSLDQETQRPSALIVEDDYRHAEMLRIALQEEGFDTQHVTDGAGALRALGQRHFDLITLDLVMPGMDGWETLERLKASPAATGVPIVIVSIVAEDNMRRGMSLGALGVLQKPVDRLQIRAMLDSIGLSPADKGRRRILIIDDDAKSVEILIAFLRDIPGLDVSFSYDGKTGVDQALKTLPDLLIVDLIMPDVNGFDVVEALQKTPAASAIPIIILTAKKLGSEEQEWLEKHVHGVFGKSNFTRQSFVSEVRRAMAKHHHPLARGA